MHNRITKEYENALLELLRREKLKTGNPDFERNVER